MGPLLRPSWQASTACLACWEAQVTDVDGEGSWGPSCRTEVRASSFSLKRWRCGEWPRELVCSGP
eukprot:scaffold2668_cov319-Prasinococcus_capsulatus_cf.AAC.1